MLVEKPVAASVYFMKRLCLPKRRLRLPIVRVRVTPTSVVDDGEVVDTVLAADIRKVLFASIEAGDQLRLATDEELFPSQAAGALRRGGGVGLDLSSGELDYVEDGMSSECPPHGRP